MEDLGQATSYLALKRGAAVYSSDGEHIGRVERVFADEGADIFDGIIFDRGALPIARHYVEADLIARIYEDGIVLTVDAASAASLPEPRGNR